MLALVCPFVSVSVSPPWHGVYCLRTIIFWGSLRAWLAKWPLDPNKDELLSLPLFGVLLLSKSASLCLGELQESRWLGYLIHCGMPVWGTGLGMGARGLLYAKVPRMAYSG